MNPASVRKGSTTDVTLTVTEDGFAATPTDVEIDGEKLATATDFTITQNGSTYTIVIKGGVIAGLDKGNHVITVIGDDNVEVSKTLTVKTNSGGHGGSGTDPKVESVKTGDAGIALYGVLALSSVLGMGWIGRKKHDAE